MNPFRGVFAALLTPRDESGRLDLDSFSRQLRQVDRARLDGYALNGATGEFTLSSVPELKVLVETTLRSSPNATVLCGIGAGDVRGTVERGRAAAGAGAHAVLLPMPCFFPYRQDDLAAFVSAIAGQLELPILLYNLPQFTSGLEVETVLSLFALHPNIVGIKDSSGSLDIVRAMTTAGLPHARLIGNDSALAAALSQGLCDGVVSGVACTLPELMSALYVTGGRGESFPRYDALLNEFIAHLGSLPTPWGLKVTSAARDFSHAVYPFPLSEDRKAEASGLRAWFLDWYEGTL